jgi:hypothetical protein
MTLWPSFTKEVSVESYISIALLWFESFTQLRSVRLPSYDTAILALDQITFRGNQFDYLPCWCGCEFLPKPAPQSPVVFWSEKSANEKSGSYKAARSTGAPRAGRSGRFGDRSISGASNTLTEHRAQKTHPSCHSDLITPSTKLVTLFNWRHIGRGVHKNSSSPPWASPA